MPPVWDGERIEGILPTGRTRPLIVSCVLAGHGGHDGDQDWPVERQTMVAKALGLPEVTETRLFAEYFGSVLAIEFGIDAPRAVLVNLSSELLTTSAEQLAGWGVQPRPGRAVGVEHRRGLLPLDRFLPIKTEQEVAEASRIYAFDLLTQNPDRRSDNPNCASYGGRFVAYDFEMAFSFLYEIPGTGSEPWEVARLRFAGQHLFREGLSRSMQRNELDWAPIREAVSCLDADRLNQMTEFLPEEWHALGLRVAAHFAAVRNNLDEFEGQLRRSLS
jgi:hypothetical protein